jgi:hypothetical protein
MPDSQIDHFSQVITSVFAKLGVNPPFIETILLCDRRYVGRKYRAGGYQLVWWVEKDAVEVFDQDGQSMRVIGLEENLEKFSA